MSKTVLSSRIKFVYLVQYTASDMNNCHFIAINFTQDKIYNRIKYILLCAA